MKRLIKYAALSFMIIFIIAILKNVVYPYMLKESGIQLNVKDNIKKPLVISDEDLAKTYEIPKNRSKDFIYSANGLSDPFRKASVPVLSVKPSQSAPSTEKTSVALTGVIWNKNAPVAIIKDLTNSKTYVARIGQKIGNAKILEIKQRSVVIRKDDETSELLLYNSL